MRDTTDFKHHPSKIIGRVSEPEAAILSHLSGVRGQFDHLTQTSDPTQITASDLVALSMIGTPVPAAAAAWLLSDDGQWLTAEILADIPDDATLQRCQPLTILRLADLFHLLRNPTSQLPTRRRGRALGQASATRILAAKRPGLVPIDDQGIRKQLGYSKDESWWLRWKNILDDETSDMLADIRVASALADSRANGLSDLRLFDILLRS